MRRQLTMRLATVVASVIAAGATACANQGPPPGGRPDLEPPLVLAITPAPMATVQKVRAVELKFDEVVSETPKGVRNLSDLVFISPKSGTPQVSWGRNKIDIKPSKGWKPNTVYSVQIKPGLVDLRGNSIDTSIRVVFSTGIPIPDTRVQGVAFDWGQGKGLASAVVEAVAPDSTTYQAVADANGRYDLRNVPPGPYQLRAYGDKNGNRTLDPLEIWDAMYITVVQNTIAEFYAFQHDTVGLRIAEITVLDSNRVVKVTFDKPYNTTQQFTNESVRILTKDSLPLGIKSIQTTRQKEFQDSLKARAAIDSVERVERAKNDSLPPAVRARNDSLAKVRKADSVAAVERQKREAARIAARDAAQRSRGRNARPVAPADTLPPPKMNRPTAYSEIFITLDSALPWQSQFRVHTNNVRSLAEISKSPNRTFSTPRAPKADSAGAKLPPGAPGRPPAPPARRDTMSSRFFLPSRW